MAQVISRYDCCSSCLALPAYENGEEAERGGVEQFQAACKLLLLFDHYIIASHAAPAVHS